MPNDLPVSYNNIIYEYILLLLNDLLIPTLYVVCTHFIFIPIYHFNKSKLNLHQAQFNEGLVTMFSGYHVSRELFFYVSLFI